MIICETKRLLLRPMTALDIPALKLILQDEQTMFAYEHAFSDEEVVQWLEKQLQNYQKFGYGLWAVILKENNELIGQCGLTPQLVNQETVLEVGYLLRRSHWHQGFAIEAALATKKYAFEQLQAPVIYSIIRDNNYASMNVAIRNGMLVETRIIKHYRGIDMPHYVFKTSKNPASID